MSPEEAIRALLDRRVEALQNKDAATAVDLLARDIVAFEMVGPLVQSADVATDRATTEAWMASWIGPISVEMRDLVIRASGDIGFAHALHHLSGERQGGIRSDIWMRSSLGFQRQGGEWRIVHAHTSVPFDPADGFEASLQLKP